MYNLKNKNILKWILVVALEYTIYVIILSLLLPFAPMKSYLHIVISIIIIVSVSVVNDYKVIKISHISFDYICKKLIFIPKSIYRRYFLERVIIIIITIIIPFYFFFQEGIIIYTFFHTVVIYTFLHILGLLMAFNYKHVYRLKIKDINIEKIECLLKKNEVNGILSVKKNRYELFITKKDLQHMINLLE